MRCAPLEYQRTGSLSGLPANQSTGSLFPAGSSPLALLSPANAIAGEEAVRGAVVASPGCCSHLSLLPGKEDGHCLLSCFTGAAISGLKPFWFPAVGEDQACNSGRENHGCRALGLWEPQGQELWPPQHIPLPMLPTLPTTARKQKHSARYDHRLFIGDSHVEN